jgi:hypothetical protein
LELTAAYGRWATADYVQEKNKMMVVKPNPLRMQYMRDSPSENSMRGDRFAYRPRWKSVFLAGGIAGVVLLGLIALAAHY